MSATVTLDRLYLNDAESPSDFAAFQYATDSYKVESQLGGGVDSDYASGRSRSWSDESDVTGIQVTLTWLTDAQIAWLGDHRGRTVCFRDHIGRKVFAVYFSVPLDVDTSAPSIAQHTASLSLTSVTFSEAA
jgi:hypothetical protein